MHIASVNVRNTRQNEAQAGTCVQRWMVVGYCTVTMQFAGVSRGGYWLSIVLSLNSVLVYVTKQCAGVCVEVGGGWVLSLFSMWVCV